jgi:hypothetical protein
MMQMAYDLVMQQIQRSTNIGAEEKKKGVRQNWVNHDVLPSCDASIITPHNQDKPPRKLH